MQTRPLGRTGIEVSRLCLGTMTFGEQNSETEAHEQLDRAVAFGINFIDTAEMYPVPPKAETQGLTEIYIGSWLKARGARDDVEHLRLRGAERGVEEDKRAELTAQGGGGRSRGGRGAHSRMARCATLVDV